VGGFKSIEEHIIELLSEEYPLTPKQLFLRLRKRLNINISYEAFYRRIKLLKEKGIIEKYNKYYSLNLNWVRKSYIRYKEILNKYLHPETQNFFRRNPFY